MGRKPKAINPKIPTKNVLRKEHPLQAPKVMFDGIPVGMAEYGGMQFDSAFGLPEKAGKNAKNVFEEKAGIDPSFGMRDYDVGFSNAFVKGQFDLGGRNSIISDDYEEPNDQNYGRQQKVPKLLEVKIGRGRRARLTDEELDEEEKRKRRREIFPESSFEDERFKELVAGSNPITPEESRQFKFGRGFRGKLTNIYGGGNR